MEVPIILHDSFQRESLTVRSTSVTWLQLLCSQTITGTSTALTAETYWSTRTLPVCDSLRSLTLPASESWDFMELILLYLASEKDITVQYTTVTGTRTCRCFCSSESKRRTNITVIRRLINLSIEFAGTFDMKGLTCQRSPKWCVVGVRLGFANLSHTVHCATFGRTTGTSTASNWRFDTFESRKPRNICAISMELSPKAVVLIPYVSNAVFLEYETKRKQVFSSYQPFENGGLHLPPTSVSTCCEVSQRVVSSTLTKQT